MPGPDDVKLPSNFDTPAQPLMTFASQEPTAPGEPMLSAPLVPQVVEKPKDYKAMAEAHVYELVSKNGHATELDVNISMIDGNNGTGKARVVIGKDAKKREFEIPITIKDGKVETDKAIDVETNKVLNISDSAKLLFDAPTKDTVHSRMLKLYDKYEKFFKGKPTDDKVRLLVKKFPSVTETEARLFLEEQYYANRPQIYSAMDKAKNKIVEYKKPIIIGGVVVAAIALAVILSRRNGGGSTR